MRLSPSRGSDMLDKLVGWFSGFTPFAKVNDFLDGKKQMLASLAAALTGTATIIVNLLNSETRLAYLMHIAAAPEFLVASTGWMGFFNALKGEKIRAAVEAQAK